MLPEPNAAAKAQSDALLQAIARVIAPKNSISFYDYMQMALYEPKLGYYQAGCSKLGRAGDFITAPELSPLFSQCLARQCAEVLAHLDGGSILEFGPGSGQMALDLLGELKASGQLPTRYYIMEISANLTARQQTLLAKEPLLLERITWLTELPCHFSGIILANEILDAMPIELFRVNDHSIEQARVTIKEENLHLFWDSADKALQAQVQALPCQHLSTYQSEINPQLSAWLHALFESMDQGAAFFIDYGFPRHEYYHPQRHQGTLMCHYRHRAHQQPFLYPGLCDLTAHVDFTALAEAADAAGFEVAGFTNQAHFLCNCGLLDSSKAHSPKEQWQQSRQIQTLIMPSEMGELFKVMALTKHYKAPLRGFSQGDQRIRL